MSSKRSTAEVPFTAIEGYLDQSPAQLTAPGAPLEFSERKTAIVRELALFTAGEVIITDEEVNRYRDAGAVIVTPNHHSFLDIAALSKLGELSGEGQPYFLSKRGNVDNPVLRRAFMGTRTFFIDDRKEAQKLDPRWKNIPNEWTKFAIEDEKMKTIIYPQGGRMPGDKIENLRKGSVLFALSLGVQVLPVGVATTHLGLWESMKRGSRPGLAVAVGEPYVPILPFKGGLDELAGKIQEQYDRAKAML